MSQNSSIKSSIDSSLRRRSISIVVACRNEAKHIRPFLNSVLAQDFSDFNWEVIIADGESNDGTCELLTQEALSNPRIILLENPARIVATGLNAAIKVAHGEIILRMDAHTEYALDYVRKCVETLEATGASNVGGPARTRAQGPRARAIEAAYHSRFSSGGARFHDEGFDGYVDTVPYGCWWKQTLERLGMFDERLVRNQDDELNLRITRGGGKIWQSSKIVSWYTPRPTLLSLFHQYFQYGFWKVFVIREHKTPASLRHLVPGGFVLINILLIALLIGSTVFKFRLLMLATLRLEVIVLITYMLGCIIAACFSARRFGWRLFRYLPFTFAVFHSSYGLGFLLGVLDTLFKRSPREHFRDLFEGVTR